MMRTHDFKEILSRFAFFCSLLFLSYSSLGSGCGGGGGGDNPPPVEFDGELEITVTSTDVADVNFLRLRFDKVQVVWRATADSPEEVITIRKRPGSFTFFVGPQPRLVAKLTIPDGLVSQIRVISSGGVAGFKDGTATTVTIPSGEQTGEKFVAENDQLIPLTTGVMSRLQLTVGKDDLVCNKGTGCHLKPVLQGKLVEAVPLPKQPEFQPGEVMVIFQKDITQSEIDALNTEIGASVISCGSVIRGVLYWQWHCVMKVPEEMKEEEAAEFYRSSPRVRLSSVLWLGHLWTSKPRQAFKEKISLTLMPFLAPAEVVNPNDTNYSAGNQQSLQVLRLPQAWVQEKGDYSVTVAILDTGVDPNHEDFQPGPDNQFSNISFNEGYDFRGDTPSTISEDVFPYDTSVTSHGTFMAGAIGASTNNEKGIAGVNWRVKIIPVRILAEEGEGVDLNLVLRGFYYARDIVKADVINVSFGIKVKNLTEELKQQWKDAVSDAVSPTTLVVVASGGAENQTPANLDSIPSTVSIFPQLFLPEDRRLIVGSCDNNETSPTRIPYTWYGRNTVDVMVPSENFSSTVRSDIPGSTLYEINEGTSLAAALTSGVAALVIAEDSNFKGQPSALKGRLVDTANAFATLSQDCKGGTSGSCGRLNAYNAVTGVLNSPKLLTKK